MIISKIWRWLYVKVWCKSMAIHNNWVSIFCYAIEVDAGNLPKYLQENTFTKQIKPYQMCFQAYREWDCLELSNQYRPIELLEKKVRRWGKMLKCWKHKVSLISFRGGAFGRSYFEKFCWELKPILSIDIVDKNKGMVQISTVSPSGWNDSNRVSRLIDDSLSFK